jgi:hypothetical protein
MPRNNRNPPLQLELHACADHVVAVAVANSQSDTRTNSIPDTFSNILADASADEL